MFGMLNVKNILWGAIFVSIVASAAFLTFVHYRLRSVDAFVWDTGKTECYKTKGTDAADFYTANKWWIYIPNVMSLSSALLVLALLYVG